MYHEYRSNDLDAFNDHKEACISCGGTDLHEAHFLNAGSGLKCSDCGLTVIDNEGKSGAIGVKLDSETRSQYSLEKQ